MLRPSTLRAHSQRCSSIGIDFYQENYYLNVSQRRTEPRGRAVVCDVELPGFFFSRLHGIDGHGWGEDGRPQHARDIVISDVSDVMISEVPLTQTAFFLRARYPSVLKRGRAG